MKEAINYQSQISECFFETLRLLKTGGEAFFGSLHHLRIQDQHDQRFWLFERIVNAFDELGITDSDIYDNPHDERTNKYNNPLVSRLRLTKLRELTAQDQENLQNILDVSKYALPPNFMKWFDEPFDWKKFSEANII